MCSDYEDNEALDRYEAVDIDDRESLPEMSRAARLAAEADMQRRDRGLPGRRAGRRENMPAFLQSDDDDADAMGQGPLGGINANRRRRQYDEAPDMDDVEEEEVSSSLKYWHGGGLTV
jgi:DNA replication licensing factor MCM2